MALFGALHMNVSNPCCGPAPRTPYQHITRLRDVYNRHFFPDDRPVVFADKPKPKFDDGYFRDADVAAMDGAQEAQQEQQEAQA